MKTKFLIFFLVVVLGMSSCQTTQYYVDVEYSINGMQTSWGSRISLMNTPEVYYTHSEDMQWISIKSFPQDTSIMIVSTNPTDILDIKSVSITY